MFFCKRFKFQTYISCYTDDNAITEECSEREGGGGGAVVEVSRGRGEGVVIFISMTEIPLSSSEISQDNKILLKSKIRYHIN